MESNGHNDEKQEKPAQEGLFDAQLTFSAPFVEAPQPLTSIVKRDGSTVRFEKDKIAEAIFRAAQAVGGTDRDRAEDLASGVTIYLAKKLKGSVPTVDQVNDAVEKVLIEMGHARTALTYARYRDRRARLRKLREGDTRAIFNELAEARRETGRGETGPGALADASLLFVRTSGETLVTWNRERIVSALVRETGLDESTAEGIAFEVENQILLAGVTTLTAPLIRELVSAKLIEHGLEEHHRRHQRLGVPLYDAERIVCGPNLDGGPFNPEVTGRVLAKAVKREYALTQVFSLDVADAHLRGDLHIHGLGDVDRFHGTVLSLEAIARFGVGLPDSRTFSKPPKYADTLLAQMVNSSAELDNHFSGGVHWDALNVFFAPFVTDFDDRALHQLAQMLIYEYAFRAVVHGNEGAPTEIGIWWDVPPYLKKFDAIGPGGVPTERTYGDYAHVVQKFAWALFDVFKEGGVRGVSFPAPLPVIHIGSSFFKTDGHEAFLNHVAETVSQGRSVRFAYERDEGSRELCESWEPRDTVVQRVTLNLPRLAYLSGDESALMEALDRLVKIAVQAHVQKKTFIEKLFSFDGLGPLGLLALKREGRPYLDMRRATYLVSVTGFNECIQSMTRRAIHESEDAMALSSRLLKRLAHICAESEKCFDLRIRPAQTIETEVSKRFAGLDADAYLEKARPLVKTEQESQELIYSLGARLDEAWEGNPIERARIEGIFHDALLSGALTLVQMPEAGASQRSIVDFIQKVFYQTRNRRVVIAT